MSASYNTGFSDGYAEGYACKLADATEPFNPQSLAAPAAVEAMANALCEKYRAFFPTRLDAIGCARLMLKAAQGSAEQHK